MDNKKILKSFEIKNNLSNILFEKVNGEYKLKNKIKNKLLEIADNFFEFVNYEFFIHDIHLVGSMTNYFWSEYSDIDLHIIVDFKETDDDPEFLKNFFDTKKINWNELRNIKIKNHDIEIYVQDIDEKNTSSGIYSVLHNEWIKKPKHVEKNIDETKINEKSKFFMKKIDNIIKKFNSGVDIENESNQLKDKIKKFRKSGLGKNGELSYENLTFKLLRRNGYIGKLYDISNKNIDKKLSINQ